MSIYNKASTQVDNFSATLEDQDKTCQRRSNVFRLFVITLIVVVPSASALVWLYKQGYLLMEIGMILTSWIGCAGIVFWWFANRMTKNAALSQTPSKTLLCDWVNALRWKITITTVVSNILLLEVVLTIFYLVSNGFTLGQSWMLLAVNTVLALGIAYAYVVELPALKNELKLVKDKI